MGYEDVVLAASPVLYLPMQETAGATAEDISGNGLDGTYNDVTLALAGPFPGSVAVGIDGADSRVTVLSDSLLNIAPGFSLSMWMRYESGTAQFARLAARAAGANGFNLAMYSGHVATSAINARFRNESTTYQSVTGGGQVTRSRWHHIVMTLDASTERAIYIDGVAKSVSNGSGSVRGGSDLLIGQQASGTNRLVGAVAHLALFDQALSAAQVLAQYEAAIPPPPPPTGRRLRVWDGDAWRPVR